MLLRAIAEPCSLLARVGIAINWEEFCKLHFKVGDDVMSARVALANLCIKVPWFLNIDASEFNWTEFRHHHAHIVQLVESLQAP